MLTRRSTLKIVSAAALAGALPKGAFAADKIRVAMVVKSLGNGFFDACRDGGQEAAKELGNVELIYTGPTKPTAEDQIAVVDSLIAQKVDAIAISANDTNALVPVCKKAMEQRHHGHLVRFRRRARRADHAARPLEPRARSAPNACR